MSDKNRRRSRSFLIYPKFQLSVLLAQWIVLAGIFSTVYFQVVRSVERLADIGHRVNLPVEHPYFQFINLQSHILTRSLLVAFGIGAGLSSIFIIVLTHRVAGPILRMRGFFLNLSQYNGKTNIPQLSFRQGDFFSELPDIINAGLKQVSENEHLNRT